jgi:hypothetical protein
MYETKSQSNNRLIYMNDSCFCLPYYLEGVGVSEVLGWGSCRVTADEHDIRGHIHWHPEFKFDDSTKQIWFIAI